jgi:hypothetical protein
MEHGVGQPLSCNRINITSLPFSFDPLIIELHENVEVVPRIGGDLWLPMAIVSPHHKVGFFFLGIDVLFNAKDKVVKIEHAGVKSKVLVWRLGEKSDKHWQWNFEHEEKM